MKKQAHNIIDRINDGIEKVSSPSTRAGSSTERAGRMLEVGVSPSVIALQMTENSHNNQMYTSSDVITLGKIYEDSKTKVLLTANQTRALIDAQRELTSCSAYPA